MKKQIKLIIAIVAVIVLALAMVATVLLKRYVKPEIDLETFTEKAEAYGYTVVENTEANPYAEGFYHTIPGLKDIYLARMEEKGYAIEMYFAGEHPGTAEIGFERYTLIYELERIGVAWSYDEEEELIKKYPIRTEGRGNYEKYSETNDTTFYYVSRIGDTIVSVVADKQYMEDIMAFIEEIGY